MSKSVSHPHIVNYQIKEILHKGRNTLWIAKSQDKQIIVVKKFGKTFLSGWEYIFSKSKARRSYENAKVLLQRGIRTPIPIAYNERRSYFTNRLINCSYICQYQKSEPLFSYYEKGDKEFIKSFAAFVAFLHNNGIRHDDLNNTNIRIITTENKIEFSIIDLNRMHIYNEGKAVPLKQCFDNMTRFSYCDNNFELFVEEYLKIRKLPLSLKNIIVTVKCKHDAKTERKKRLKKLLP